MNAPQSNDNDVARKLAEAGVFAGMRGLEGLLNATEFWEQQAYGTRLYYGHGGQDYLHHSVLAAAVKIIREQPSALDIQKLHDQIKTLRAALERIQRWEGEFPKTERTWPDGTEMSYFACYGSNGERDFMRGIAREALTALDESKGTNHGT
jgi:hypothetical protein